MASCLSEMWSGQCGGRGLGHPFPLERGGGGVREYFSVFQRKLCKGSAVLTTFMPSLGRYPHLIKESIFCSID